jgi:hypothetical protein
MDSWFDLILRIIIVSAIIGAVLFVMKKKSEIKQPMPWHQYSDEVMLEAAEGEDSTLEKPTGPPPPGSFE